MNSPSDKQKPALPPDKQANSFMGSTNQQTNEGEIEAGTIVVKTNMPCAILLDGKRVCKTGGKNDEVITIKGIPYGPHTIVAQSGSYRGEAPLILAEPLTKISVELILMTTTLYAKSDVGPYSIMLGGNTYDCPTAISNLPVCDYHALISFQRISIPIKISLQTDQRVEFTLSQEILERHQAEQRKQYHNIMTAPTAYTLESEINRQEKLEQLSKNTVGSLHNEIFHNLGAVGSKIESMKKEIDLKGERKEWGNFWKFLAIIISFVAIFLIIAFIFDKSGDTSTFFNKSEPTHKSSLLPKMDYKVIRDVPVNFKTIRDIPGKNDNNTVFRGDSRRTGVYNTKSVSDLNELKWKFKTGLVIWSSPVIFDSVVYFGSNDHYLYAVDVTTGTEDWKFETGGLVVVSPAVAEGIVYSYTDNGVLYAVDAKTGLEKWRFKCSKSGALFSVPVVAGNVVYCGGDFLYALEAKTGREKWRFKCGTGVVESGVAIADGTVYFTGNDRYLYAVNDKTGQEEWRFKMSEAVSQCPAVVGETICLGTWDAVLHVLDRTTGKELREFEMGDWSVSFAAFSRGIAYFGVGNGYVFAVDLSNGNVLWHFKTNEEGTISSPSIADDVVYFGSADHFLYALDTFTGKVKWKFKTGGKVCCSPSIADGVVYFGSDDHFMYAVK